MAGTAFGGGGLGENALTVRHGKRIHASLYANHTVMNQVEMASMNANGGFRKLGVVRVNCHGTLRVFFEGLTSNTSYPPVLAILKNPKMPRSGQYKNFDVMAMAMFTELAGASGDSYDNNNIAQSNGYGPNPFETNGILKINTQGADIVNNTWFSGWSEIMHVKEGDILVFVLERPTVANTTQVRKIQLCYEVAPVDSNQLFENRTGW